MFFWTVAVIAAAADLLTKHYIFEYFPRRFPQAVEQALTARSTLLDRLAEESRLFGQTALADQAQRLRGEKLGEGNLNQFVAHAEATGRWELVELARRAARVEPDYPPIVIVRGLINIVHSKNRGGVFGLAQGSGLWLVFGVAAGAAVIWFAHRRESRAVLAQIALGLVLAGAIGNVYDRVEFGYVRDFVDVCWRSHHWPAFNVADAGICVGAIYLALYAFFLAPKEQSKA